MILDTLYLSEEVEAYSSGLKNVYTECEANHIEVSYKNIRTDFLLYSKEKMAVILAVMAVIPTVSNRLKYPRMNT